MNFTLELNTKKLNAVADALQIVAENINIERHNQQQNLNNAEQLNLRTELDGGIMDARIDQTKSLLKFLTMQEDLLQSILKMARTK